MNNIYEISPSAFYKYLERGLGRTFLILKNSKNTDIYKDEILYGCLNNTSYDFATEGTRAYYIFSLLKQFNDMSYFENKIFEKFNNYLSFSDFTHLCDMLLMIYYENKNQIALNKLEDKFKELITKNDIIEDDVIRLEYICINLSKIYGLKKLRNLILKIDQKYNEIIKVDDLYWFYDSVIERNNKLKDFIQNNCINFKKIVFKDNNQYGEDNLKMFNLSELINDLKNNKNDKPFQFIKYKSILSTKDKDNLIDYYIKEKDINQKIKLLGIIKELEIELPYDILINDYIIDNVELKTLIINCALLIKNKRVKDFGYKLLASDTYFPYGIMLISKYYEDNDYDTIYKYLTKIDISYCNHLWHDVFSAVFKIFSIPNINYPVYLLYFLYENTLCSFCREYYVRKMKKLKLLTTEIIEECKYDANYDIVRYVKRIKKNA